MYVEMRHFPKIANPCILIVSPHDVVKYLRWEGYNRYMGILWKFIDSECVVTQIHYILS